MNDPEAVRLDTLLDASVVAHEATFNLWRNLRAEGALAGEMDLLLKKSVRITLEELPALTVRRAILYRWSESAVLQPEITAQIRAEFEAEMNRVEPKIKELLIRQRDCAARLREVGEE